MKRILIYIFLLCFCWSPAYAEVTDWLSPGTAASVDRDDKADWVNPDNIKTVDTAYARNALGSKTYGDWLRATNFNFDAVIPEGATIVGIEVQKIRTSSGGSGYLHDDVVRLRKTSGQVGDNKANASLWTSTGTTDYYGGESDLWGTTWSRAEVVSEDFGVDMSIFNDHAEDLIYARIYNARIRVYYSEAAAPTSGLKVSGVADPAKVGGVASPAAVAGVRLSGGNGGNGGNGNGDIGGNGELEVYMTASNASCNEGDGTKNIQVRLSEPSAETVTVNWVAIGTASYDGAQSSEHGSGADFSPASGEISFSPGQTEKNITLTIVDNTAAEPDQKLNVILTGATNATVRVGSEVCNLTIADNDRDVLLDVTNLPSTAPLGGSGWGGSNWNLVAGGNALNNRNRLQAILDHFKTHHSSGYKYGGAAVVLYFPVGTYTFETRDDTSKPVVFPLHTNKITMIGGGADGRQHPGVPQTVLKMATPYEGAWKSTRMFVTWHSGYTSGYTWTHAYDSEKNRLLIKNLVMDGDAQNCGGTTEVIDGAGKWTYPYEQCYPLFIQGYKTGGRTQWAMEKTKIINATSGAFAPYEGQNAHVWQFEAENCVKGFVVMTGGHTTLYAYDIKSGGDYEPGGIWMEPNSANQDLPHSIYGDNWYIPEGRHFKLSCGSHPDGRVELSNVYYGKNPLALDSVKCNMVTISANLGQIDISDSTLHFGSYPRSIVLGIINFTNCDFISYPDYLKGSVARTEHCINVVSPTANFIAYRNFQLTYTNCTFSNDGKASGYGAYGLATMGGYNWDDYPNNFVKFINCTFDNTLDGAFLAGYRWGNFTGRGGWTTIFEDCIFNTNPSSGKSVLFEGTKNNFVEWHDSSGYRSRSFLINPTFNENLTDLFKIYGYADSTKQNKSWLYMSGTLPAAQAANSIAQYASGITNLSIANAAVSAGISSIPRSSQTTVTTSENHGLTTGDKIIFDGFDSTANASWFTNLSPHTNVPLFTAEVVNATQFKVKNEAGTDYINSSGYSANYDSTKDTARVSKYPFRTITGTAGDNPVTSKPAGLVGDRYVAGTINYRCTASGTQGRAVWTAE
jgi:hypothetical protein